MLGSTVVCWDINEDNNKKTVDELGHLGYKAHAYNCDVSSREQVFKIAREVKEKVGDVTVVVNNAGIMPCHPFMAHNSQEIQRIFDINVMAHFWMLEAFLPSMINKNHGHIVALSSMAGLMGIANLVPYCASKYAVRGLMEAMAEELREGNHQLDVKFTTICPFIVDTGLCKKPRTRFPSLLGFVPAKKAASEIIKAMRTNQDEVSIPNGLLLLNHLLSSSFATDRTSASGSSFATDLIPASGPSFATDLRLSPIGINGRNTSCNLVIRFASKA
ncbi:unnamed protein product [Timema podura]|uniref:Uncharacterized protein n=1 Tax=Timema podura TaxID=61482 RepID=A0ABN7NJY5_TIMPD|nr:unnamed protein product [Timema podura]